MITKPLHCFSLDTAVHLPSYQNQKQTHSNKQLFIIIITIIVIINLNCYIYLFINEWEMHASMFYVKTS